MGIQDDIKIYNASNSLCPTDKRSTVSSYAKSTMKQMPRDKDALHSIKI